MARKEERKPKPGWMPLEEFIAKKLKAANERLKRFPPPDSAPRKAEGK